MPRDRQETARLIGIAVAALALVGLMIDNHQSVRIGYVIGSVRTPLFVVLIVTALLGAVVGGLLQWRTGRARK
jgi:uncharacterized integral membrane protein